MFSKLRQLKKAFRSISERPFFKVTFRKLVHPSKAEVSMVSTLPGIITDSKEVQSLNAHVSINSIFYPKLTSFNEVQLWKALDGIHFNFFGMEIFVKDLQLLNK